MKKDENRFKVLFVCTGNTCRSPMAEGILRKMLKENKLDNFEVRSAGISTFDGAPPSLFALEVAKARHVDLTQHRSKQLNKQILSKADLILVMSAEHMEYIRKLDKKALEKTHLLKTFPPAPSASNEGGKEGVLYVKDPMGGSMDGYNQCFQEIEKEISRIFPALIDLASKRNLKN